MNNFLAPLRRGSFTVIFSFFAFFVSTKTSLAQCSYLLNALPVASYTMVQSGGINGVGVAYSAKYNIFYAAMGGSAGLPLETFNAAGTNLFQATTGTDFRGVWFNPNDLNLEANGVAGFGSWRNDMNAGGYALSTGSNPIGGQNQPDPNSCGAYDCSTNEIIYYFNGSIYNYDPGSGQLLDTVTLTGSPVPFTSINSTSIGFLGCPGGVIALEDYVDKEILFFTKTGGVYVGECNLPVSAVTSPQFNFSYAGDLAWLFDTGTRTWTGYQLLTNTTPQPVVNLGRDTTLCTGVTLTLDAGNPGATYIWQDGSTAETFAVSQPGTYYVNVSNGTCNIGTDTININYYAPIAINLGNDTTLCMGNSLLLGDSITGATYHWQDGTTTDTLRAATSGQYAVTVTVGTCSTADTINVTFLSPPIVSLGNDTAVCPGKIVILNATNAGATYKWSNDSTKATDTAMAAGTYKVTVTISGCPPVTDSIKITNLPRPIVNLGNDTSICDGGNLLLNATNTGATYKWQDGSTNATFNVTVTGLYSVTVTLGSCTATGTINVTFTSLPAVNLGNDTAVCPGNIVVLNATTAGATYKWSNDSTKAIDTAMAAGTYRVTVTISGCTPITDSIKITNKPQPTVKLGNDTTICGNGSLLLNAGNAGATYHWQDGSANQTFNATTSGQYSVTVTTTCPASDTINVTFTSGIKVNLGNDTSVCPGQPLTLNATTAGATYKWQDGTTNPTYNVTAAGTYSVTVTPAGCSPAADTIQVSYFTPPTVNLGNDTTLCQGQPLNLNATTAGATYNWQDGATTANYPVATNGNYAVTVTDANKCTASDNINVTFTPKPVVNLGPDTALCNGQTITLDATTASAAYVWQDASTNPTFTATTAGAYSVTVTVNSCTASDTVNVTYNPPPTVSLGKDTTLCPGQTLLLNATNAGAKYRWQDGTTDSTYTVSTTGNYSVTVTAGSCPPATGSITATYVNLTPPNIGPDTAICPNQTITLDATTVGATAYQWSDGSTTASITASQAGEYKIKVIAGSCPLSDSVTITLKSVPTVNLGRDTTICSAGSDSVKLNAQNPGDTYVWKNKTTGQTLEVKTAGKYWVTVSNTCGTASDTVIITEKDCFCQMLVPNAFTPNGDGKNDIFKPYFNCTIIDYHIEIYNRWGELVYKSDDFSSGWDGVYRSSKMQTGVYVWIMTYDYFDMNHVANYGHMSGDITLFR